MVIQKKNASTVGPQSAQIGKQIAKAVATKKAEQEKFQAQANTKPNPKPGEHQKETDALKKIKERVYGFEQTNRGSLVLYRCGKGWYKMGGHSALFMRYRVAERIRINNKLHKDDDYDHRFAEGVMIFTNVDKLTSALARIDVKMSAREGDDIFVYNLGYELTDEEIEQIRRSEEAVRGQVQRELEVKDPFPGIAVGLRDLMVTMRHKIKNADGIARDIILSSMMERILTLRDLYDQMADGEIEFPEMREEFLKVLRIVKRNTNTAMDLQIWDPDDTLVFTRKLGALTAVLAKATTRYSKKNLN